MRPVFALLCLALAGPAAADTHGAGTDPTLRATANGLVLIGENGSADLPLPFGTPFHEAMPPLARLANHDLNVAFPEECPAGPVVSVTLPGRLDLIFQEDRLAGWFIGPGDAVGTADGLAVGTPRDALKDVVWFSDSTLGEEFSRGGISGLVPEDGAAVSHLWAGVACIFR